MLLSITIGKFHAFFNIALLFVTNALPQSFTFHIVLSCFLWFWLFHAFSSMFQVVLGFTPFGNEKIIALVVMQHDLDLAYIIISIAM